MELKREPWRRPNSAGPRLCQWPALHRPGPWPGPGPAVFLSRAAAAASEKPQQDFPVRATPSSSSGRGSGGVSPKGFQFLSKKLEGPNPAEQSQVLRAGRSHVGGFPTSGPRVDLPEEESGPGFCRSFPVPPSFLALRAHPPAPLPAPANTRSTCTECGLPSLRGPPGGNLFLQPSQPTSWEPCFLGALLADSTSDPDQGPTGDTRFLPMPGHGRPPNFFEDTLWEPQELKARLFFFFLRRPGLVAKQKS